jgi:hypothetical protein
MGILFDRERRLLATIALERDLAASFDHPDRRRAAAARIAAQVRRLPQSPAERLLLTLG